MAILGSNYPEIWDLISLAKRMGHRMPIRTMAEHCRMAAISIYDLEPSVGEFFDARNGKIPGVELYVVVRDSPDLSYWRRRFVQWRWNARYPNHLLLLEWKQGQGLVELFNGPAWTLRELEPKSLSRELLARMQAESDSPIKPLAPDAERDYLSDVDGALDEIEDDHGGNDRGRGDNMDGGAGGDGPPDPPGPDDPGGPGGGGMGEVLAHPVLFSTSPESYRSLLENY